MTTAQGRLHAAALELSRACPMKQRLTSAFSNCLKDLETDELPPELRAAFGSIADELQSVRPMPGETAIQATVRKMSPEQAEGFAARIVDLYGDLLRAPSSVTKLPVREKSDTVVPLLFAAEA